MAEITLKGGKTKIVSYNTAAKIHQLQQGNVVKDDDIATLKKIAAQTVNIDFKRLK